MVNRRYYHIKIRNEQRENSYSIPYALRARLKI